jgi:hypothetical protein
MLRRTNRRRCPRYGMDAKESPILESLCLVSRPLSNVRAESTIRVRRMGSRCSVRPNIERQLSAAVPTKMVIWVSGGNGRSTVIANSFLKVDCRVWIGYPVRQLASVSFFKGPGVTQAAAREPSPVVLRIALATSADGLALSILKRLGRRSPGRFFCLRCLRCWQRQTPLPADSRHMLWIAHDR